jgi:hypothetical protein
LVDSGATGSYVSEEFVKEHQLQTENLPHLVPVYNVDGTSNKAGPIRCTMCIQIRMLDHIEIITLVVTNTSRFGVIIGFDWLWKHNPTINWTKKKLSLDNCPAECFRKVFQGNPDDEWRENKTKRDEREEYRKDWRRGIGCLSRGSITRSI